MRDSPLGAMFMEVIMDQNERRNYLIRRLLDEDSRCNNIKIPEDAYGQASLLRGLMNIRMPGASDEDFIRVQDEYLAEELRQKGITDIDDLLPVRDGIYLWQGDITTLRCDAIVNAANSGLTGCYVPNHRCIDNCIHTYAGIQLRSECASLMKAQGHAEPTGHAKITKAYNLPCSYVIHTVGPIISGRVTKRDRELLSSCYRSCLLLAAERGLESVAFCCISTGEFHFPGEEAARIAVRTVRDFMASKSSVKRVVFNVFKDTDKDIYERLLRAD